MRARRRPTLKAVYSVPELASMMGLSRSTIWRWAATGKLPAKRLKGGTFKVTLEDIKATWPELWESICDRAKIQALLSP